MIYIHAIQAGDTRAGKMFGGTRLRALTTKTDLIGFLHYLNYFSGQVSPAENSKNYFAVPRIPGLLYMYIKTIIFLTLLIIFSVSCLSASLMSSDERLIPSFDNIIDIEPEWGRLFEGIEFFNRRVLSPRLEFFALRIDLAADGIEIVVSGGTLSARVSSYVRDNNLLAGINAVPFDIVSSLEGQPVKNSGLVISGGTLLSPAWERFDALVFYTDGSAAIVSQSDIHTPHNIVNAAGGFHQILVEGEAAQRTQGRQARHPRSAAGISANGQYLFLTVIDGKRAASIGATELETAHLLSALGAWNGLNLDGGGSSALAVRDPNGNVNVINTPTHGGKQGQERAVASCLGIRRRD